MRGYKNFEGNPHPGDLRHLVEIGYTENAINENGYPEPQDVVICRVWAAATDAGNQHYRAADVTNTEAVINFTIRYRSDIKPGMWVRFQNEKRKERRQVPLRVAFQGARETCHRNLRHQGRLHRHPSDRRSRMGRHQKNPRRALSGGR